MRVSLLLTAVAALALGATAAVVTLPETRAWLRIPGVLPTVGKATVGGPFTLVDHTGKAVTDKDFRSRFLLVFFGFTYCPDVCPSGLQVIAAALDKIGPK